MPDEITCLVGDGGNRYPLLFLIPIETPKQIAGANVVPTPSSGLDSTAAAILSQAEKDELDAGTLAFRVVTMGKDASLSAAELAAAVQERYAEAKQKFDEWYAAAYRHVGLRVNAE